MSRSDVEKYGEQDSTFSKNSLEQKEMHDSFEQDAIEGWDLVSYDTTVISTMKSKIFNKSSFSWLTAISSLVIGALLVLGYQLITHEGNLEITPQIVMQNNDTPLLADEKINIESTEVIIPVEIEKMIETIKAEQIIPEVIIETFVKKEEFEIEFPALEPIRVPAVVHTPVTPIIDKIDAKEIYLNDLKLIDYRAYRNDPFIETEQLILTGTSADKEDKTSESFEYDWKNVQIPYIQYLDKSVYYFNKRKSKKALARFETIIKSYPLDVNANFYSGVCLYNFGEYTKAISRFETCINSEYRNFDDESIWMKALCLEHLNRTDEAKKLFHLISENKGFYANQAKEKLKSF